MQASVWERIDAPTLTLSFVAVALHVAFRITTGAGFGFVDDPTSDEPVTGFLANAQPRLAWVLGYGAPGMLAVLGVVRGVRARGAINLDWALSWLLLLTLLLMVLAVPQ